LLIKLLSGKDPYSGRALKDMKGWTGNPTIDAMLQATPVSRAGGTAAMLADERKTTGQKLLNALTGVKIGTYNLPQQKVVEMENLTKREIADDPYIREFTRPYLPQRYEAEAGPETKARLELLKALEERRKALMDQTQKPGGALGLPSFLSPLQR
jgi:hypothetical protein